MFHFRRENYVISKTLEYLVGQLLKIAGQKNDLLLLI